MKEFEILEAIGRLSVGQLVNFHEKIFIYDLSKLTLGALNHIRDRSS